MTLAQALVYLVGAVALAVPATVRALPRLYASLEKWTQAKADLATAQLVQANANGSAMQMLTDGVKDCEKRCNDRDERIAALETQVVERDEELLRVHGRCDALHEEMKSLREELRGGHRHRNGG